MNNVKLDHAKIIKDLETIPAKEVAINHKCSIQRVYEIRRILRISQGHSYEQERIEKRKNDFPRFNGINQSEIDALLKTRKNYTGWIVGMEKF